MTAESCDVLHCRNERSWVITTLSCLIPLAGFEVSLIGRFSGVPRGLSRMAKAGEVKRTKRGVYGLGVVPPPWLDQLRQTAKLPKLSDFDGLLYRLWTKEEPWVTPGAFIELRRDKDLYPGLISRMRNKHPFEFLAVDADSEDDHL